MYSQKVLSIFNSVEKQSSDISQELDSFMGNILKWADELRGILEQEYIASKDSALFLLPKTPSEKKTRNGRARNGLVSKCSVINSTFLQNETITLDETISTRTRGAKRAATSKISQINASLNKFLPCEMSRIDNSMMEKNTKDISDRTFVLPKASTRTKPVLTDQLQETQIIEEKRNENEVRSSSSGASEKSPAKRVSKSLVGSPSEGSAQRKSSRNVSVSGDQQTPKEVPTSTTFDVNETLTERPSRRKSSRASSGGAAERSDRSNLFRSRSGSAVLRSSEGKVSRSPSSSPVTRSSSLKSRGSNNNSGTMRTSRKKSSNSNPPTEDAKGRPGTLSFVTNETITIKKETSKGQSMDVFGEETFGMANGGERTSVGARERSLRSSGTASPIEKIEENAVVSDQDQMDMETEENLISTTRVVDVTQRNGSATFSVHAGSGLEEASVDVEIPKKKRKVKKDEEVKENVEEMGDTVRITRTKSKAIRKMMEENETKQADLSAFAKKILNRAKMTSLKKNQLAALLECNASTPTNGPGQMGSNLPFGNLTTSKSKYHLLLSGSKKLKTPLATLPNSAMKVVKASGDKERMKLKPTGRDSSVENAVRSVTKPGKDDLLEKEIRLQSKKEKEKEAALKRQNVIKTKQEELKRKNELKHQLVMKKREKLEQEKYNLMLSEREKEERHKLILQERQMRLKEEAVKKKMITQQKIAETVERRRLEEEARLAKLKEMEAEEQRLALEKQREQERQEKRAQERLAQKKAREEYEMQLKQELEAERLRAEKILTAKKCLASASKLQSASKRQKFEVITEKREWDYKPRNENDYGLENEQSEIDSEDEKSYDKSKPVMPWAKKIMHGKSPFVKVLTLEMLCEFLPCYQKSPDIYKMFRMTPSKRIKRSSSAIWNTPSS